MSQPHKKHRLYVSIPLFTAVLVASMASAMNHVQHVRGSLVELLTIDDRTVQLESTVVHAEGNVDDLPTLQSSANVQTYGASALVVQEDTIMSLLGGYSIRMTPDSYVVSAITSPVLIRTATELVTIVPIGMQYARDTGEAKPLPVHYLQEQMKVLQALETDESMQKYDQEDACPTHVDSKAQLLASADAVGKLPLVLSCVFQDVDLWLLASFHPDYASIGWVYPHPADATDSELLLRRALLLKSDTARTAVSPLAVRMWKAEWQDQLATTSGASILAHTLVDYAGDVNMLWRKGLPERASRYHAALLGLINQSVFLKRSTEAEAFAFATMREEDSEGAEAAEVTEDSEVPEEPEEIAVEYAPPAEQEAQTKQTLIAAGCMFMGRTSIAHKDTSLVLVSDVVIGGNSGDKLFSFTFDTLTQQVHGIVGSDGKELPYAMALQQFMDWAKR